MTPPRCGRLQSPLVDRRIRKPIGLEEVLDMRDRGLSEGPDDVAWAGGAADYWVGWVIWAEGTGGELLAQHGELVLDR